MNTISFNLGFILFFALFVWVFLANNLYLKCFFLKRNRNKRRNEHLENFDNEIFEQAYGGKNTPKYIKDSILKSQDKHQLLSLYLASKSLHNVGIYNNAIKDESNDRYSFFASIFIDSKHFSFNWFLWIARFFSILVCLGLFIFFFDEVFLSKDSVISNNDQFIIVSIFIMFILMPYNVFSKYRFFDKLCSLFVLLSSILVALFSVVYIHNYSGDLIFNKLYLSIFLAFLIILVGAYSYIGYTKLECMVKFFELLKVNQQHQVLINDQSNAQALS